MPDSVETPQELFSKCEDSEMSLATWLGLFRIFGDTSSEERKRLNWSALVDSGHLDASQYAVA